MAMPNPNAPSPASSEGGQSLYADGNCPDRAGGGYVPTISRGVIDSVQGVPNGMKRW